MRSFLFLWVLFLFVTWSKAQTPRVYIANENKFKISNGQFIGQSELKKDTFSNGLLKEVGRYAYDQENELSTLKIDEWSTFYDDGQLKSKGKYEIGSYIQCCMSGPCKEFYNFKIGIWKYYHPNGQIFAEGEYEVKPLKIDTSCQGGDNMPFGIINSNWQFFDSKGNQIHPAMESLLELESVFFFEDSIIVIMHPDKEKEKIEVEYKF